MTCRSRVSSQMNQRIDPVVGRRQRDTAKRQPRAPGISRGRSPLAGSVAGRIGIDFTEMKAVTAYSAGRCVLLSYLSYTAPDALRRRHCPQARRAGSLARGHRHLRERRHQRGDSGLSGLSAADGDRHQGHECRGDRMACRRHGPVGRSDRPFRRSRYQGRQTQHRRRGRQGLDCSGARSGRVWGDRPEDVGPWPWPHGRNARQARIHSRLPDRPQHPGIQAGPP